MKYKAILFDLDGTLLPMTNETLEGLYLPSLSQKLSEYVKPDLLMKNMWESLSVMMSDSSTLSNEIVFFDALDRKSTRLNSSHVRISYAVFCLKKKKKQILHP